VRNAGESRDGANAAARDDARALARGAKEHARRTELAERAVRDRRAVLGDAEEILLGVVDGLRDREWNLARFAVPDADAIDLVADHHERGEREAPAALDDLGDAVDLDHALLELARFLAREDLTLDTCHLELQPSFARAVGERLDASVVQIAAAVEDTRLDPRGLRLGRQLLADLRRLLGLGALEGLQPEPGRARE